MEFILQFIVFWMACPLCAYLHEKTGMDCSFFIMINIGACYMYYEIVFIMVLLNCIWFIFEK